MFYFFNQKPAYEMRISYWSSDVCSSDLIDLDFAIFDCIVFHYSLVISRPSYIKDDVRQKLREYKGPKVLFIQDEMRWVAATSAAIRDLDITTEIGRASCRDRVSQSV